MKITIKILFAGFLFISSCSPSTDSLYEKANKLENKGNYKEAIKIYTKIIKRNSKLEDAFFNKGVCYLKDSNYSMAHSQFQILLNKRKSGNYIIRENKELLYGSEVANHEISTELLYYYLGIAKYRMDSLNSAYACFEYVAHENFEVAGCYTWQGLILLRAGKSEKGCELLKKSMEMGDANGKDLYESLCKDTANK